VFCVEVLCDKARYFAIANMGFRPTVGGRIPLLEVHLFSETPLDLYGKHLEVFFHKKLREERRFDTFEVLQAQILEDVRQAKAHWHLV
jgi:riboflavin kinase / FMN adenylyltransferase